jgi:hypothetical protein
MDNVIDIEQCESLPLDLAVLEQIGSRAIDTARRHGWDALVDRLVSPR